MSLDDHDIELFLFKKVNYLYARQMLYYRATSLAPNRIYFKNIFILIFEVEEAFLYESKNRIAIVNKKKNTLPVILPLHSQKSISLLKISTFIK